MVGVWTVLGRLLSFLWELSIFRLWIHEHRHVRNRDSLHQLNLALLLCANSLCTWIGERNGVRNPFAVRGGPAHSLPPRPLTAHRTSHRDRLRQHEKVECYAFVYGDVDNDFERSAPWSVYS